MERSLYLKINQYDFYGFLFLLLSPLLAIPPIFLSIYYRSRYSIILFSLLVALLQYQLIPYDTNDLARHYTLFDEILKNSYSHFIGILGQKVDSLFYMLMYGFGRMGLSKQLLMSILTFITIKNFLQVFVGLTEYSSKRSFFFLFIVFLCTFQWPFLMLGVRNYLAFSFVLLGIYKGLFMNKKGSFLWLVLASTVHYSSIAFFPVYLALDKFKNRTQVFIWIFIFSMFLQFTTKEMLLELLLKLPLPPLVDEKIIHYLGPEDIIEKAIRESVSAKISFFIQSLWVYFAYVYLILTINRKSMMRNLIYALFILLGIFSISPDPFNRFTFIARPLFLVLIAREAFDYNSKLPIYFFSILMGVYFILNIYITKDVYYNSFFNLDFLSTLTGLLKDIEILRRP